MVEEGQEGVKKGYKEARIGLDSEKDLINMINNNKAFQESIRKCLIELGLNPKGSIVARKDDIKADIFIKINDEIGISLKSSTKTSFHHLDRRSLEEWKNLTNMPDEVFKIIKEAILRVSRNSSNKFILEKDRDKVASFFIQRLEIILREVFTKGEEKLKVFMINNKQARKLFVFRMDEVLDFLFENARNNIGFTNKGIIKLGDFITVQRKGGNGRHVTIPKTVWQHPGNQLQFKFSPLKFVEHCERTKAIRFCVIEY